MKQHLEILVSLIILDGNSQVCLLNRMLPKSLIPSSRAKVYAGVSNLMRYAHPMIAIALLAGCASRSTVPDFSGVPDSRAGADPYEALRTRAIVPGDRFPLSIGLDPRVVVDVTVDPEGYIELPQIGRLHVAGMIGTEMEAAVAAEYEKRGIMLHGMVSPGAVR